MTNSATFAQFRMVARRKGALALCLALCTLGSGLSGSAREATFTTFDVPGATGTFAQSINPAGAITGTYSDASSVEHGFLRARDGTFTTFDAPGAIGTFAQSINPAGAIAGQYFDATNIHGFLRAPDGTFTTFDAPSAVNGTFPGCLPFASSSINPVGAIAGCYADASNAGHGFLRAPDGTFTTFDAPGAVNGTLPVSINPAGAIAGYYVDASNASHGFLRVPGGTFTTFDAPGAVSGTFAYSINPVGAIAGQYYASNASPGFLRAPDGTFTTFDVPGSPGTFPYSVNRAGAITGVCLLPSADGMDFLAHGFLRARDGTFTTFDAPGATNGTWALSINPVGAITGYYAGPFTVYHGFLRSPLARPGGSVAAAQPHAPVRGKPRGID